MNHFTSNYTLNSHNTDTAIRFLQFALDNKVLKFGEFITKSGRKSPYFFNTGLFNTGTGLWQLSQFYAETLYSAQSNGLNYDMLLGPAYKGITLVAGLACALAANGKNIGYAYNRKESKIHGEGGMTVGMPLKGRVLIVDDVISAGTSIAESVALIKAAGAIPAGVLIALDRMERYGDAIHIGKHSAVEMVQNQYGIPVYAIANLNDLMHILTHTNSIELMKYTHTVSVYRKQYGI